MSILMNRLVECNGECTTQKKSMRDKCGTINVMLMKCKYSFKSSYVFN